MAKVLQVFAPCLEDDDDKRKRKCTPSRMASWAKSMAKELKDNANIHTISKLSRHCRQEQQERQYNVNNAVWNIDATILQKLRAFLPGPVGEACFQLARQAVERVEQEEWSRLRKRNRRGMMTMNTMTRASSSTTATTRSSTCTDSPLPVTKYEHRSKHGGRGKEEWVVWRTTGDATRNHHAWAIDRMYVDCAGFIRNVLCSVMNVDEFTLTKSDRDFMRAKDFFNFFRSIAHSVAETDGLVVDTATTSVEGDEPLKSWRRVDDLRMLLPGDVIVYRREGKAAGGAAFTNGDLKDLLTLLKAVRTAQLYEEYDDETGEDLVDYNVAKDDAVAEWAVTLKNKLSSKETFGIMDLDGLKTVAAEVPSFWSDLKDYMDSENCYENDTVDRMYEALYASEGNTGHIMFAAGLAELSGATADKEEYRVPVLHSTGFGKKYKGTKKRRRGVERSYRRFTRILATNEWIRERGDGDLSGGGVVDVLAARICY